MVVPGLSSALFSAQAHLEAARGNSCALDFAVSVLRTAGFVLPLLAIGHPSSGLFSFSGVPVAVLAASSALVAPSVPPPACSSRSTSSAPLDVWHHHLGHPCYGTLSQLKLHVRDFVVNGPFKPDKSLGPGCVCGTCVRCNLHRDRHHHTDTEAHTATAPGQLVYVDGASGFPCSSLVHAFVGIYRDLFVYSLWMTSATTALLLVTAASSISLRVLRSTVAVVMVTMWSFEFMR